MPRYIRTFPNALDQETCNRLISKFEESKGVKADPQPEYTTRRSLFLTGELSWASECMDLVNKSFPLVDQYFERPPELAETRPCEWLDDGWVMACYDQGATCAVHADGQNAEGPYNGHRIATMLFFLNDVPEGGEIYFPLQDIKIKPEAGKGLIFPPGYHHPHEVLPPKTARYVAQTWITDAEMIIQKRPDWEADY